MEPHTSAYHLSTLDLRAHGVTLSFAFGQKNFDLKRDNILSMAKCPEAGLS